MPVKNHNFKYNIRLLESGYEGLEDNSVGKVLALCTQGSELDTNNSVRPQAWWYFLGMLEK